jgi:rare lipoprotein A
LLFAAWLTALALPILVIDNIPKTEARAQARVETVADATSTTAAAAAPTTAAPEAAAPAPTEAPAPAPTAAPAPAVTAPPATVPKIRAEKVAATTTTAAPRPPPTTEAPSSQEGGASWYDYNPGECAHQTLPKGTVVTITNLSSGATATCTVTDRGPYGAGRIIDLDKSTFAQLADPSSGIIQVRITW